MISIAMCTCNGEKYISDQLISLAGQSCPPDELIICDDLSQDKTVSVIREFMRKSSLNIRLYQNQERLGIVRNFAQALSLCQGEYIGFADQDDVWLPDKLKLSLKRLLEVETAKSVPCLVHTDLQVVDSSLRLLAPSFFQLAGLRPLAGDEGLKNLLVQNYTTGCTMLFNQAAKRIILPLPETAFMHDWWSSLAVAAAGGRIAFVSAPTVLYRQHSDNALGTGGFKPLAGIKKLLAYRQLKKRVRQSVSQVRALRLLLAAKGIDCAVVNCYLANLEAGSRRKILQNWQDGVKMQNPYKNIILYLLLLGEMGRDGEAG